MSSNENDSPTSLKIANYFFEVGLNNESLIKQFAKQINEESINNRRKLKRLLSNANPEGLIENREFFQNYKRNENFSSITESINSLSVNNDSLAVSSFSSIYHSDESLENQKISQNESSDIKIPVPNNNITSETSYNTELNNTANTGSVSFSDKNIEKELPPLPPNNENNNVNDDKKETKRDPSVTHIVKSRSISRSSLSMHSLTKKISSTNTLDSLNLCIDEKENEDISPETLETNHVPVNDPRPKEMSFNNNSFQDKALTKLKSVSSMPLINSNSLKKSLSKSVLVHEFDDDAPLAYVSIL
ncbi:hypothetical protein PIROE2DRAFT_14077 [Piromyces sp. E2]|nr:hypothetical protein PIROE2DRAFT_14077 [Piromyces sp. E2]|eukprot:OUM60222.1 hypothetical protein PIROE2DRAFT_14077 [Piromyces sp. E2]